MRVWTKQHYTVIEKLLQDGRYACQREYVSKELGEYAYLFLEVYNWLVKNIPNNENKPEDAKYPIWLSLSKDTTMLPSENFIIVELEVDEQLIWYIDINKWTRIINYSYIPFNKDDETEHLKLLHQYNTSDCDAYMSNFYPHIKKKIINSWPRLFDKSISLGSNNCYGNIWEIKKEWIIAIEQ